MYLYLCRYAYNHTLTMYRSEGELIVELVWLYCRFDMTTGPEGARRWATVMECEGADERKRRERRGEKGREKGEEEEWLGY